MQNFEQKQNNVKTLKNLRYAYNISLSCGAFSLMVSVNYSLTYFVANQRPIFFFFFFFEKKKEKKKKKKKKIVREMKTWHFMRIIDSHEMSILYFL